MANRQIRLMSEARERASFDSRELTNIIYGGAEAVKVREAAFARIEQALQASDPSKIPDTYGEVNRMEQYLDGLRFGKAMLAEKLKHGHSVFDTITPRYWMANASPFGLHVVMFIPALKLLASPEQLSYWLPLSESCKIIGTYCQTELGHGSFVRGLETTATFDAQTDEFVIHSPTTSSTKYWPGGLGYSASHAIVMAHLIVGGTDHGVHPFIVQLRSLDDYAPLPGIELGDIGLKVGHTVRIPRMHLLARHAQVAQDGTYTASSVRAQLVYGTMLFARRALVANGYLQLAQAATIALPTLSRSALLAFRAQHQRLLTLMARSFALLFVARDVGAAYDSLMSQIHYPNGTLAGVHAALAGLKAYATQTVADGVEDARRCCGGHGYLAMAGFAHLVATATVMATVEGETLSFSGSKKDADASVAYLRDGLDGRVTGPRRGRAGSGGAARNFPPIERRLWYKNTPKRCACLRRATSSAPRRHGTHMMGPHLCGTRAHRSEPAPRKPFLQRLCSLSALTCIDGPHGQGFLEDGHLTAAHLGHIRTAVDALLDGLLPDAIALADAWNFSDASLESALGCRDGNVYERMMQWTRQVPLNPEHHAFEINDGISDRMIAAKVPR
ncbi:acyl-CoA oxidase [Mycena leptocephala]|nr:acyl-CoA oxidase [Mycena leptocephala]